MSIIQAFEKYSQYPVNRRQVLTGLTLLALTACSKAGDQGAGNPTHKGVDYYTCPMHPQVHSQDPNGHCPVCGMNLVPVMKASGGSTNAGPAQPSTSGTSNS